MSLSGPAQLRRDLEGALAVAGGPLERFAAEMEFAEALADLPGMPKARWGKLMAQAWELVRPALAGGDLRAAERAVVAAEELLAPIAQVAKGYTIHCAGHAHIDMNWMWSWPETVAVTHDTFETALKLMDEFDDFCLTQSQASVYAIVAQHNPDMLKRIARRVKEGRWEVAAAHWVEGDRNLASGESLARHLLYTRRYMRELFGLEPADVPLDWSPDTFGHAWTIPSIDARGGVRRYYMCRGGAFDKPPVFWWQGPDGSRVLVNLETTWYIDHIGPHNALALVKFCKRTGLKDWLNVYGVGDHGGGPTRRDLLKAREMDAWPVFPRVRLTTTGPFFDILERHGDRWPVLARELNYEFTGCYTSQASIKRMNREGECLCLSAECAAALAYTALGRDYPHAQLRDSWINVLFGHFHDILPGSGVRATREYQSGLFQQTAAATNMIRTLSHRALAAQVATDFAGGALAGVRGGANLALGGGAGRGTGVGHLSSAAHVADGPRAFVVFNPTAGEREEVVTVTLWDVETKQGPRNSYLVRRADGGVMPAQRLADGEYWGHFFVDLAVPVRVGPMGYQALVVEEGVAGDYKARTCQLGKRASEAAMGWRIDDMGLENEHLRVVFDSATGGVKSLLDKASNRELACPENPLGVLEYRVERPRGGSAWVINDAQSRLTPELRSLKTLHNGPLAAGIEAQAVIGDSSVKVVYTLRAHSRMLEIDITANWLHRGSEQTGVPQLAMRFPLALDKARGSYEIPFGSIERTENQGQEVPAINWANVTGVAGRVSAGAAVLNNCKYGHSLEGSTLRVTLIRSTCAPDPLPEMGEHQVRLAIAPHDGRLTVAELTRRGAAFNQPLVPVATDLHAGRLPSEASALTVGAANVVVTGVKKAEDDEALLVRLVELAGKATVAKVRLEAGLLGQVVSAGEVDLLEAPLPGSSARKVAGGFEVAMGPHAIATVKLILKPRR